MKLEALCVPLALAVAGCASVPRPAELDDAVNAMNGPETRDLAALRPALLAAAKDSLRDAEQAFAAGDGERARMHAELTLQRIRAAENFVARDGAAEQARLMSARLATLGREIEEDRTALARLAALNERLDKLVAGAGSAASPALDGARKALIAARNKQVEAASAGAPSLARDRYAQGVALLEGSASALEMKLAEDSATASAGAIVAFTAAIDEAAAARAGAAKAVADAKSAAPTGKVAAAGAPALAPARSDAGRILNVSPAPTGRPGGDATGVRPVKNVRIQELLHSAEDAKADALGRGAANSASVVQGTYLLQLAREALSEGDEARATEKAREARQAFGSANGTSTSPGPAPAPVPKPPAPPPAPVAAKPAAVDSASAQDAQERKAAAKAIADAQQDLADVIGRGHPASAYAKAQSLIHSAEGWLDRKDFGRAKTFAEDARRELKSLPDKPPAPPKPAPPPAAEKAPVKAQPKAPVEPDNPKEPPKPAPAPVASGGSAQKRSAESFAEETIRSYRGAPAQEVVPAGWEDPYRKVIQALALRDKVLAAASTPAAKAAVTIGSEKLAEARAAWVRKDLRGASALAETAIVELMKASPAAPAAPVVSPGGPTESSGKVEGAAAAPATAAAPVAAAVSDNDAYRKADSAIREAGVLIDVCDHEKCEDRSLTLLSAGKAAVASARTAFGEKRYDYAAELAADAKTKLAQALLTPKPQPAAPAAPAVDAATLKKQKTDADDAIREANVQRQLCDQKKCAAGDIEPWLRAESHLAAASAAYADGDFERAKSKAAEAERILKAQLDAQAKAAAAAPPPAPAPKPAPKGLVLPSDVSNVVIKGNQLIVSPSIQFATGISVMTATSRPSLDSLARVILHNKKRIQSVSVIGYTDNKGVAAVNTALSERRAKAVADGLVAAGVDKALVSSQGRGPENPIADNSTPEGRNLNRRVEVHVNLADDGS